MDGIKDLISLLSSQPMPDDPAKVQSLINQLQDFLIQLEQGKTDVAAIKQKTSNDSNPIMQILSEGLQQVKNNEQAKELIKQQIQNLEQHLKNLKI